MANNHPPDDAPAQRAVKIKSTLGNKKSNADQRFSKTSVKSEQISGQDDLRTMLNRIRKGLTHESVSDKQDDEQPA